jgi:S1-C subfamily serine protease
VNKFQTAALLALSLQLVVASVSAWADDIQPLAPRQAVIDTTPPEASPTLNGAVSRTDSLPAAPDSTTDTGTAAAPAFDPSAFFGGRLPGVNINTNGTPLQLKTLIDMLRSPKMYGNYSVTINGKQVEQGDIDFGRRRPTMSSDDFRKLEHGVVGLEAVAHMDSACPVVTQVAPTCPAALAGIRPGDLLIKAGDHVFKIGEGQVETWNVIAGKAGTPVDIVVLRDGQELTFHIIRMNIEDIQDDHIRTTYERLLSALGPPGQQ